MGVVDILGGDGGLGADLSGLESVGAVPGPRTVGAGGEFCWSPLNTSYVIEDRNIFNLKI